MESGKKTDECRCYGNSSKCDPPKQQCPPAPPCCPCPPYPIEKCKISLQTVQKLVEAENHDIELAALLSGIKVLDERRPKKKILNVYDATSKSNREKIENDVSPQYLAYIMRSIENGLSMKTDPIEVYEHLFSKGNPDAPFVSLGPTAAISTEDTAVPLSPPTVISAKDPDMEQGARLDNILPKPEVYVAEPSTIDKVEDLKVLLGGSLLDKHGLKDDNEDMLNEGSRNMKLEIRSPVQSAAVLRGSTPPAWFPGYNVAFPNTGHPAVVTDPETVLDEAWFYSQPLSLQLEEKGAKLIGT